MSTEKGWRRLFVFGLPFAGKQPKPGSKQGLRGIQRKVPSQLSILAAAESLDTRLDVFLRIDYTSCLSQVESRSRPFEKQKQATTERLDDFHSSMVESIMREGGGKACDCQ